MGTDLIAVVGSYRDELFADVKTLWEEAFPNDPPWNRAEVVIPSKMATQPDLFLVATDADRVVGAALAGYDGHRGWLYSVAVKHSHQRTGLGSALVRTMEERLRGLGCLKINLQVRSLDMQLVRFYHHLGYASEDRISMGRRFHPTTDDALPLITDRFLMTDAETPILTPMANKGVALPQADRMPRRNLMLTASIKADGLEAPVRIRNLSVTGAMIEGPALPLPDTRLILRRLDVEIGARVVWVSAGRCGVQFEGTIAVEDWTPGIRHASAADLHGQARVDAIQAAIRSGETLPVEKTPGGDTTQGPVDLNLRLANELAYVRRLLDAIGEELVRDPIMMQRHGQALQSFDIACQLIDHLGVVVCADDPQAAAREVTMDDLRSRLVGKSIF